MPIAPPTLSSTEKFAVPIEVQCAALCEHCLALLDTDTESTDDIDLAIHEMRVATKRLRAAWHLVKNANPLLASQRRDALRRLSAEVAGQRDQAVLLELARSLADENGANNQDHSALTSLIKLLHSSSSAQTTSDILPAAALRAGWSEELSAWRDLDLDGNHDRRRLLRSALRESQKLALGRTKLGLIDGDTEVWHDWRKAVKRLRYQREFIAISQARALGVRDARISRLGTRLGERNDLANLAAIAATLVADTSLTKQQHGRIRKAIAQRERSVLGNARRLGRLAFIR